ncbi:alpha-(1-_3)-arabinofuranosyltransferase domain-containing protein [Ilumatobacter sp.]|uniref:alpha-(1->3)-arabinofuranosyltransferase domain-containing protein n=1 Tax=Ilumatobacter sp. TaxID=1967498 RepID=UPI003B52E1F8
MTAIGRFLSDLRRHRDRQVAAITVAVLAVLAYAPSLRSAPGLVPADSKLYVYLDPGRFLADTLTTFDPRQFGGWVPHQHIAYLWPTGPWFWVLERTGVADWVAHRLWIGSLLLAAGLGVRWCARVLGSGPLAAFAAGLVYQLSPYVLAYLSRTSVLLLPWAGLGWIVGCTILAAQRGRWRYPALVALIVATVGAVNATALAMIVPAPVLWLVHATWGGAIGVRRALATVARIAALCVAVSLWWVVMLVIQGRHGAEVLAFSESLAAVSFTSTSTEVVRGLGYWLFYVRDAWAPTTAASFEHLVRVRTVVENHLVILLGMVGIVATRWEHRRFAALLVGAGVVLGVGVHPIDDPSPLMSLLVGDGEGGVALALRSSTRAVPVLLLGAALGVAALVGAVPAARRPGRTGRAGAPWARLAAVAVIAVVAIDGLPALRGGRFVDPFLVRDQDPPAAWLNAAADLDARPDGYRVLQVPGAEFGAFGWGYTVDQPLPALTERPLLTRDLLPLGSPAAMDLLFALDDRIQSGAIEPAAVAGVSRFLGVDTVWIAGDVDFGRFRLARPEVVTDELTSPAAAAAGLVDPVAYGDPAVMSSRLPVVDAESVSDPRVGAPVAPVTLVDVADPVPIERVKDTLVVLAGSGDGIVDATAAGVLDGSEAVLYSATAAGSDPPRAPDRFVITDSNRDRAHHWRSSQDVTGFTESGEPGSDLGTFESGDQRLDVFGDRSSAERGARDRSDSQTVSIQEGPVTARASGYGEPFAYLPEHRPVMAIDGDPATAWVVADRSDPVGEWIELDVAEGIDHVDLLQPTAPAGGRSITRVALGVGGADPVAVDLDGASLDGPGQRVPIEPTAGPTTIRVTILDVSRPQPPIGDAIGAVGFSEIGTGLAPTVEIIRAPVDGAEAMASAGAVDVVLTRLRAEPTDRWRDDPEPVLRREFALASDRALDPTVTLRLDRRLDGESLAGLLDERAVATEHLTGAPAARGAAAVDDDPATAWTTPFDRVVGQSVVVDGEGTADELTVVQPVGEHSPVTALRVVDEAGPIEIDLEPAPAGSDVVVELPRTISLDRVAIEIVAINPVEVRERRFDEPTVLPAAIAELRFDGRSPAIRPVERLVATCRDDLVSLDGRALPLSWDVSTADALAGTAVDATPCAPTGTLAAGDHRIASSPGAAFEVDRVVLSSEAADPSSGSTVDPGAVVVTDASRRHRRIEVPACPRGCWVIHGEGWNVAWTASIDGRSLGEPTLVDGNANGWWIEPSSDPVVVDVDWPVQRSLDLALLASALAVLACIGLVAWDRRRDGERRRSVATVAVPTGRRTLIGAAAATVVGVAVLVDPLTAVPAALAWTAACALGRPRLVGWVGVATLAVTALVVAEVVRTDEPFPNAGWPVRFEYLHPWSLLGVLLVTASCLVGRERPMPDGEGGGDARGDPADGVAVAPRPTEATSTASRSTSARSTPST